MREPTKTPYFLHHIVVNSRPVLAKGFNLDDDTWEYFSELHREYYELGEHDYLMQMLMNCSFNGREIPLWAGEALRKSLLRYASGDVRELGKAFGIEREKHWPQSKHKIRHQYYLRFCEIVAFGLEENRSVKETLNLATKELPISIATAKSWYYEDEAEALVAKMQFEMAIGETEHSADKLRFLKVNNSEIM